MGCYFIIALRTDWDNPEHISELHHFESQYNWNGLEFPQAIQTIGRFERNNPGIAVNVLFNSKESIYTARRSEFNRKCDKQANSLTRREWRGVEEQTLNGNPGCLSL